MKKCSDWLSGRMRDVPIGFRQEGFYSMNVGKRNYCEKFLMVVLGLVLLQCDNEETFLLVIRNDAGCSYWF
jgi:hypothetical protein